MEKELRPIDFPAKGPLTPLRSDIHRSTILENKRSYFGNAQMFSVQVERDPHRPVGKLYVSKK